VTLIVRSRHGHDLIICENAEIENADPIEESITDLVRGNDQQ